VIPLSRTSNSWALAIAVVMLASLVLGLISEAGVHWTPGGGEPGGGLLDGTG
jgi:hypothetical protein